MPRPKTTTLYYLRTTDIGYKITKILLKGDGPEIESEYDMIFMDDVLNCMCPAAGRETCRHRQMFQDMLPRVDTPWFYNFDTKGWEDPTGKGALHDFDQSRDEAPAVRPVAVASAGEGVPAEPSPASTFNRRF